MNNHKLYRGVGLIHRYLKLNHSSSISWRLMMRPICASTEIEIANWIAEMPVRKNQPKAIFASCQKFGQGQADRIWQAPKGGVWVSAAINREGKCENNSQLYGLAVATALAERIERLGVDVNIKWPNDLLVNGQKLAGILPRLFFRGGKLRLVRVGVGLNVINNVPEKGISLKQISGNKKMNINFWSSEVLFAIERSLEFLENKSFLRNQVKQRLWSKNYIDKETGYSWDIKGVDDCGRLILLRGNKEKLLPS